MADELLDTGWTRKENGTYQGPDGTVLTARMYKRRIDAGINNYTTDTRPHTSKEPPDTGEPYDGPEEAFSLPTPKSKSTRVSASSNKATAKELTLAFETMFLIVTSIMSLLANFPDIAMTESEANSIAVPLGNILQDSSINKQFGKLIANSGDYSLLGYAVYLYLFRVANAQRERVSSGRYSQTPATPAGAPGGGGATSTGPSNGAFIPMRPSGLRGIVPPVK